MCDWWWNLTCLRVYFPSLFVWFGLVPDRFDAGFFFRPSRTEAPDNAAADGFIRVPVECVVFSSCL